MRSGSSWAPSRPSLIDTETVVNTLSRQLTTASNSVESLGRRTRAMSRKLKGVETLPDDKTAESLLGFSADDFIGGGDEGGVMAEEGALT